jgi:hypothetical protein
MPSAGLITNLKIGSKFALRLDWAGNPTKVKTCASPAFSPYKAQSSIEKRTGAGASVRIGSAYCERRSLKS